LGIVHRDIKPGNLLVDGRGNLWVTDFGLAHIQQSEAHLTVTGQALGTPRYMSPEQALAKRVPIDHRTDVCSLGATLYELLTLRPAFESEDRQELLRQIAFDDPAKLRRLERAIPAELEIIVLKAMEKRPQDRYATAKDLADDLQRWLLDQPIRARRPGMVQRAAKWGRRHRPLVVAAVVCLFLALVTLAISNVVIWREHEETKEALRKAKLHQKEVDVLAARMVAARDQSEVKLLSSLQAMDRVLTALEEPFPEEGTESARIYKAASEQAMKFYKDVLPIKAVNPYLSWEVMWAYVRLGSLCALHNKFTEAQQAYLWAVVHASECQPLPKEGQANRAPADPGDFRELERARLIGEVPERPAIEKAYRQALAHWRKTSPKGLGVLRDYRTWAVVEARFTDSRSLQIWERVVEDLPTLFHVEQLLSRYRDEGKTLRKAGRLAEEKAIYHRAVQIVGKVVHDPVFTASLTSKSFNFTQRAGSDDKEFRLGPGTSGRAEYWANVLFQFGVDLDHLDMAADAEAAFRASLALYKHRVPAMNPLPEWVPWCELRVDVGKLSALLSGQRQPADNAERLRLAEICLESKNRYVMATRFYRDAFAADPKLAGDQPSNHRYNAACAAALAGCGQGPEAAALDDKERIRLRLQALDWLRTDLEAWRKFQEKEPFKPFVVEKYMSSWLHDIDFADVRGAESLAKLPEAERQQWQQLWRDVQALRERAAKSAADAGLVPSIQIGDHGS
jgi:hypothetical protein